MTTTVFDKTEKGREEIATRSHHLAPRLRTLLLLVDGKRDTDELMAKVGGLGLDQKALVDLLEAGFIEVGGMAAVEPVAGVAVAVAPTPSVPAPESPERRSAGAAEPVTAPLPEVQSATEQGILREGETQFQALYNFFTETIRSAIGLRGYGMQLKIERASSIADFKALRQPYLDAVLKAKGPELEHSLRNRLDQLLKLGD
ncbi:MAG: hypothetical protein H7244_05345 [Herminiimonas sp.]|nr:hypothetical protein [Herminiimonas sp.]